MGGFPFGDLSKGKGLAALGGILRFAQNDRGVGGQVLGRTAVRPYGGY